MKKIMTTVLLFAAISAYAHPDSGPCSDQPSAPPDKANTVGDAPAPHATPADHSAAGATDHSVIYVGTNDFYLALVREGILKA